MAVSIKPAHLKRYRDVVMLLVKHGRGDLVRESNLLSTLPDSERPETTTGTAEATALAEDLEELGPTYVKLGQLLSTRADLLPVEYLEALTRLQDDVEPFAYEEVEEIVRRELGVRISKAFAEFEPEPLAAASLGQVHRAVLRSGEPVAVKVQRPGIRDRIAVDLEAFGEIAGLLDETTEWGRRFGFREMIEEFGASLIRELDYRTEAEHLETFAENLAAFDRILIPRPVGDYTTDAVLTMEFVRGVKVTALGPLAQLERDTRPLADVLFRAYLEQVFVDGLFHADPHPGNVFLTEDGRLALIDLGMVARVPSGMREDLLKLLLAIGEGDAEQVVEIAVELGEVLPEVYDAAGLGREVSDLVGHVEHATMEQIQVGRVVLGVSRLAARHGLRMPTELTMLGKALMNLDAVGRTLDPDFDPNAAIRKHAAEVISGRMMRDVSPSAILRSAMEAAEFAQELPARANRILEMLAANEFEIHVDAIEERTLIDGFEKIANRITLGLILAALIVGAAMLMRVETDFTIAGYPGLAMVCFLGAVAGGVWLVVDIVRRDR